MTKESLIHEIKNFCRENADENNVIKYSRYFKEGVFNAWGVSSEKQFAKRDEFLKNKEITQEIVLEAGIELFEDGKYDECNFSFMLLKQFKKNYSLRTLEYVEKWFEAGINNWAHTDVISGDIISVFLTSKMVEPEYFISWIRSEFKFKRRAVPVSFIKFLKLKPDYKKLFTVIEPLMTDSEREVHQGVGWFLREAWKKEKEITEEYLLKWKNISPRLIFQYACEKMTKEEKLRFKKEK